MMEEYNQEKHGQVIKEFLKELSETQKDAFILKGGTALLTCYGLNRFSEDIDLDGKRKNIKEFVKKFCENHKYEYRIAKDTEMVKRAFVNYGSNKPLKIEVSYRRRDIPKDEYTNINGINVYSIDKLCVMKCNAYMNRDKIRDLYDLCYIGEKYYNKLSAATKGMLQDAIGYKGLEQFDYVIQTQKDPLIDNNKLAESFLNLYDKVGLLYDKEEKQKILSVSGKDTSNDKTSDSTRKRKLTLIINKDSGKNQNRSR